MRPAGKSTLLLPYVFGGAIAAGYLLAGFFGILRTHPIAPALPYRELVVLGLAALVYLWPVLSFFHRGREEWRYLPVLGLFLATHFLVEQTQGSRALGFGLYVLLAVLVGLRLRWKPALALYLLFLLLEFGASWTTGKLQAEAPALAARSGLLFLLGLVLFRERLRIKRLTGRLKETEALIRPLSSGPGEVDREAVAQASLADARQTLARAHSSLNEELDRLILPVQRAFGCQSVAVLLLDSSRENLVCRALRSYSKEAKPTASLPAKQGILGWILREGKDFLSEDFAQRADVLGYYDGEEIVRSVAAVPILLDGRIEGVLAADDREPRAFDATRKENLKGFATVVAGLLRDHRDKLLRGIAANQYRALNRLSATLSAKLRVEEVLDSLMDSLILRENEAYVVRYDHLVLLLAQPGKAGGRVRRVAGAEEYPKPGTDLSLGGTLTGKAMEKRLVHYDPDLYRGDSPSPRFDAGEKSGHGFHSFLAVPLVAENECLGAMVLESGQENAYEDHDREVVSILANQAAMALKSAMLFEEKEALAFRDGLTGLANHRHFQEVLANELARAKRGGQPLSLSLLDLDHFKSLNDAFGHPKGDEVLVALARLLEEEVRGGIDTAARYGGEEFVLVLAQTSPSGARELAERIRARVAGHKFPVDRQVTVSIGLASYPSDAEDKGLLVAMADRALYVAKRQRNRVSAASDPMD